MILQNRSVGKLKLPGNKAAIKLVFYFRIRLAAISSKATVSSLLFENMTGTCQEIKTDNTAPQIM